MSDRGEGQICGETLEERIRLIENRPEIYNPIASHPPSVCGG
jgi:hypothetical protein